jgi:hypothetical protein
MDSIMDLCIEALVHSFHCPIYIDIGVGHSP